MKSKSHMEIIPQKRHLSILIEIKVCDTSFENYITI